MTVEQYVTNLKALVPKSLIDATKDWSTSDQLYVFLHNIQLKQMEDIKEMLKAPKRVQKYSSKGRD